MTVGELIEKLSALDPGLLILTRGYEDGFDHVEEPVLLCVWRDEKHPSYCGEYQQGSYGRNGREELMAVSLSGGDH